MYDFLFVGSGLFSCTFAHLAKKHGYKCLIIEKRDHAFGNCYTEQEDNINIHKYGPHIFHTNDDRVWQFVNQFAEFNNFINRPKVNWNNEIFSFPINLMTLYQLWGVTNPKEALIRLDKEKLNISNPKNLEEWALSQIGEELYYKFIYGYTKKQWNTEPKNLPTFIIKRLPIRLNYDDNYYFDKYQGIPIGGYTEMLSNMTDGIEIILHTNYFESKNYWDSITKNIIYTGPIDRYFDYEYGKLDYRSLKFEKKILEIEDFQGNAVINYTENNVPYTRIIEHKHFESISSNKTIVSYEYPANFAETNEPYYPINNVINNVIYDKYKKLSKQQNNVLFGGRLAEYKYYDMHQVIGSAMSKFLKLHN